MVNESVTCNKEATKNSKEAIMKYSKARVLKASPRKSYKLRNTPYFNLFPMTNEHARMSLLKH